MPRVSELTAEPALRVIVKWAINENLSEGLTKDGARLDGTKILQAIRDAKPDYDGVFLEGTYPLVDRFGNTSEETVVRASYSRATIERINFRNFSFKNVYEIADSAQIHPSFRY